MAHRKFTLNQKLALLIVVAAMLSGIVFLTLQKISTNLIDSYMSSDEYYQETSARYIKRFSQYVSVNELASTDRKAFGDWVRKENYIMLTIFKDQMLQYDSNYTAADEVAYGKEEVTQYLQNHSHPIKFSDGEGRVIIDGFYSSRYYDLAFTAELIGATCIFLMVVLLGIRRSLRYLRQINREIHMLEGGELDYQMTVKGHDEIALIAESIEELRKAFLDKLEAIEKLQAESRSLVTEMSHDMRTPLTSLIMYLEFAKQEDIQRETEQGRYVANAYGKALQLKTLSDNLFDYFLLDKEQVADLESVAVKEVIYDLISDQMSILHQEQFRVRITGELPDTFIQVNMEELGRIFDNIMSNLLKYADPQEEIDITFVSDQETFEIHFSNRIKPADNTADSTGLGERSITRMMSRMQGQFHSSHENLNYRTVLRFWNTRIQYADQHYE
ncbi:HAMP domain-containing histidine kinase [Paenibacillus barcinonensis]|uniref:histidine kinase n=1 Tax=Paenibacillus barcinonensis TaxID=198119 RepID=A0A2V4W3R9_PAEBA|nr:HAMP domain-containing sensor histidine kinase [Paenibacillus barcinonensis]PYE49186.1 signal transduction histidine kinase [Paenibacillus barcinonensis]QKS55421.1 HAMP domain-containing histidine kinase [Paenibacillus barcinonensis]